MLFYVLAVLIRVVSTRFETIDPSHVKLWDFVGGLSPLIGAIVVIFALRRKMKTSLFGTSVTKSILTLAVPFGLFGIVDYKEIGLCLWLLFVYLLYAFFEEVGWRGYLLKQFEGKQFLTSAIIIGLIWGLWHAPLILLGHNYPQHPQWGVLFMMVMSAILSIIIQYVRIKSGSVIVAAIMHGTLNALAGTGTLFVDNFNDLINGCCGVVGMTAMAIVAFCIFLFDRYVTRDHICTSPIALHHETTPPQHTIHPNGEEKLKK